jgi:hypothetical protein
MPAQDAAWAAMPTVTASFASRSIIRREINGLDFLSVMIASFPATARAGFYGRRDGYALPNHAIGPGCTPIP